MLRSKWLIWLPALAAAWLFDFLFWKTQGGINYPIWITILTALALGLAHYQGRRPARPSYLLAALAVIFSIFTSLRSEGLTVFLNGAAALACLALMCATLTTGNWPFYRIVDYLLAGVKLAAAAFSRALTYRWPARPEGESAGWKKRTAGWAAVLRGMLIALPILAVLAALLASADLVFASRLGDLLELFNLERVPEYIFRLFYILVLSYLFSGVLLHALYPEKEEARPDPQKAWVNPFLGLTETVIVLGAVDLLLTFFVTLQFQYLFGGQSNIKETGFTYSEYAVRGFTELVLVAVLSIGLYLVLNTITRRKNGGQALAFNSLAIALMLLVLVILASSFQRLLLYENAYGFSQLRLYTHIFIIWLALLLAASAALTAAGKPGRFGLALFCTLVGFTLTLALVNVDAFITRQNVNRALQGKPLDDTYLGSLSSDAVPALFELYDDARLPQQLRNQIGAELSCRVYLAQQESAPPDWRAYHFSRQRAAALLTARGAEISAAYPVIESGEYRLPGVMVNGAERPCTGNFFGD